MSNRKLDEAINKHLQESELKLERTGKVDKEGFVQVGPVGQDYAIGRIDYRYVDKIINIVNRQSALSKSKKVKILCNDFSD